MATKLFVGGLAWGTTDDGLKNLFAQVGQVVTATVISDRFSGRSKGFGFVEMATEEEAAEAIKKLNGAELDGRKIIVNEARPKPEGGDFRPQGGGGFGGDRGGDRRGGSRGGFRSGGNRGGGYR
jgi:RNA recognition motif-containing protein